MTSPAPPSSSIAPAPSTPGAAPVTVAPTSSLPGAAPTTAVVSTPASTPSPTNYPPVDTSPAIIIAACIAVAGVAVTGVITWLLGRRNVKAAEASADAAKRSSIAAEESAQAAQESVGVNRETAMGVARRAEQDALAKRYQDATGQLGSNSPAIRIAAVHALGRLGDDWLAGRQTCLDLLCAYLQMPYEETEGDASDSVERQERVRQVIITVLNQRFSASAEISWSDLKPDFSNCVFQHTAFRNLVFQTEVSFKGAMFFGACEFEYVTFGEGADFSGSIVGGRLSFDGCGTGSGEFTYDNGYISEEGELYVRAGFRTPVLPKLSWLNLDISGTLYLQPTKCFPAETEWDLASFRVQNTGQVQLGPWPDHDQSIPGHVYPTITASYWFVEPGAQVKIGDHLKAQGAIFYTESSFDHWSRAARVNREWIAMRLKRRRDTE